MERLDDIFKCAEIVEVIGVDVEYYGYIGEEFKEVILEFAGLAYHDITFACNAASADAGELSADICGEVYACCVKYLCYH